MWIRTSLKSVDDNVIQTAPTEDGNDKLEGGRVQRTQVKMSIDNSASVDHLSWNRGLPRNA